jgi:DNA-binding beta-propeller fold protein YncE
MRRSYRSCPLVPAYARLGALGAAGLLAAAAVSGTAGPADAAASAGLTASYILPTPTLPSAVAVNAVTDTVYLGSAAALTVVDGASETAVATIPLAAAPTGIAVDSATNTIYVLISGSTPEVAVIDGASNSVSATIALPDSDPVGIAADSVTDQVYVGNDSNESWGLFDIDGSTDTVAQTFSTGADEPAGIAVDESTDLVWMTTMSGTAPVLAINAATGSIVYTVSVTGGPTSVAVDPVTDTVYTAGNATGGSMSVIDGATGTIATTIAVTAYNSVAVDPSADVVYLPDGCVQTGTSCAAGTVVIDGASNTVADVASVSGPAAAVDPATGSVYEIASAPSSGLWALTPSAANAISPTMQGGSSQTLGIGIPGNVEFLAHGLPTPTITETGSLPAGFTFRQYSSSDVAVVGVPLPGSEGVYPITMTASNGVAPDYTTSFTITVTQQAVAVGVEGTDGQLWAEAPQLGSNWQPLGGQISGAPAVVALPNAAGTTPTDALFIATGSNGELWMRSLTLGWQPVGPSEALCIGSPAAVVTGTGSSATLTVACEGLNRSLYYTTTAMPSSGLPSFTGPWTSLGGVLSAGPAVAPLGGVVTFFAEGTNGQVFTNTGAGYTATPWLCIGSPAAVLTPPGPTVFACHGLDGQMWYDYWNSASGWETAGSWGGLLIGGVAVAMASDGDVDYLGEGLNNTVWEFNAEGWFSLGGDAVGGVGAAALT